MKKTIITIFLLVSLNSSAVFVNHKGLGEVVLIPYYSVNNQLDTYVSLTNTTSEPKAIKINIREGLNGYAVLSYNVYLDAYDTWVYALVGGQSSVVGYSGQESGISVTNDSSCAPFLDKTTGQELLPFALVDGPDNLSRSREGFIEILEMGVLTGDFKAAVAMNGQGTPENCTLFADAWQDGGEWAENPQSQVTAPTGGLMVQTELINVSEGINYSIPVTALSDFYADGEIPHVSPGDIGLSLDAAAPIADIETDDRSYTFTFDHGEDAVSAVLMTTDLYGNKALDQAIGADTEMVFSQPTRRFYFSTIESDVRAPYSDDLTSYVTENTAYGCTSVFGSETVWSPGFPNPIPIYPKICGSVFVNVYKDDIDSEEVPTITGSKNYGIIQRSLHFNFRFDDYADFAIISAAKPLVGKRKSDGALFYIYGLPIRGVTLYKFGNSNASNGLLAQYGASSRMKQVKTIIIQ